MFFSQKKEPIWFQQTVAAPRNNSRVHFADEIFSLWCKPSMHGKKKPATKPNYYPSHASLILFTSCSARPLYHKHIQHLSMHAIHSYTPEHRSTRKRSSQLNNTHPYTSKCTIQSNKKKYSPVPVRESESPRAREPQSSRAQTALQTKTKANAK